MLPIPSSPEGTPALREVAQQMRIALEMALTQGGRSLDPAGTCALGALLVLTAIEAFTPMRGTIKGGAGERDEGLLGFDRRWHGHYWVEAETPQGPFLVDVTADQFGFEPVVCEPLATASARYRAGDQQEVDEQIKWTRDWLENPSAQLPRPA